MLTTLLIVHSFVSLFSVVKEAEGPVVTASRLVFDLRGINYRFTEPPWAPLGAAGPLVKLDVGVEAALGWKLKLVAGRDSPECTKRENHRLLVVEQRESLAHSPYSERCETRSA